MPWSAIKKETSCSPSGLVRQWKVGLALCGASVMLLAGCSSEHVQPQPVLADSAVPVTVATVTQKTVPVEVRAIGNVEAYSTVSVKAQLAGEVEKVYFKQGQDVSEGDLLFTLDRRPFEATLQQLEANLERNEAQLKNASAQAERMESLFHDGIVSKEQFDTFRTNADALAAAVRADEAAIKKAGIDLDYCTIHAPISGRTGDLLVHPGNIVKSNESILVVINQVHPVYVAFSVPEQNLAKIRSYNVRGPLKVEAYIPDDDRPPSQGALTFIDNAVDASTGTIALKATFRNPDDRLWPGQFVNVVLKLTTQPDAVVVPSQAVQTGQSGFYAYVVKSDLTAELRPVVPGSTVGGETVIENGLTPGERVVTDGQLRLFPGAKMELKNEPQENPEKSS
ncbi:MAG: efflux RND transporter periplasmic adaptor subunit [Acidobacteria bacterium]|nr:efflux RND transporter periplasmic adaptor subunit [Acidobacteriota bacterium]